MLTVKLPEPLEEITQAQVAYTLEHFSNPGWLSNHIPLGELRDKRVAAKLKRMGTKPGWGDFVLIGPDGQHYYLELKRGRLGRLTPEQQAFQAAMAERGVPYAIARSYAQAINILRGWGATSVTT